MQKIEFVIKFEQPVDIFYYAPKSALLFIFMHACTILSEI